MNSTDRALIAQRWSLLQIEILPYFNDAFGILTPKLEKLIHVLELTRIEDFVRSFRAGPGRPAAERGWFANAFVAKSVLSARPRNRFLAWIHSNIHYPPL